MKIALLCENSAGAAHYDVCLAEWGLSAYIEINGVHILFDTGTSFVYKHNAKQLGIDLNNTDYLVLSHYHLDHTGGLRFHEFKTRKKMVMHPQILEKLPQDQSEKIRHDFDIITSEKPYEFTKDVFYLGEIPRITAFEKGKYLDDPMLDDSAIAVKTKQGVFVITGCSHSGICNICEYAKQVTGQNLYAVLGGFHLFESNQTAVDGTIKYLKQKNPKLLYPMHCIDMPTMSKLFDNFHFTKYSAGDQIEM